MKHKLKLFLVGLGMILLPLNAYAATLTFEGSPLESTATYEIKYNPGEAPQETISLKIDKTNDDLTYEINSDYGTCDKSKLECTLITTTITTEATVATLNVSNLTTEAKETTITIGGTLAGATKTFTLKAGETTTTTTQRVKSSDANLSNLTLSLGTMDQPFSKDINSYVVTGIKDTINSVTISPDCEYCTWNITCPNGECSIDNTKRVNLQMGANQVAINVESEDGTSKKTYTLNIYRGDIEVNSAYLSNIQLNNSELSPKFDSMTNDYTAIVGLDVDSLDIETIAEDPSANILIKGNENFIEGENTVTITVTSSDGQNKQVYTIIVTKQEVEDEEDEETEEKKDVIKTNKVEKKKNNTVLIIILSVVGLGLIIGAYLLIFKIRKNKKNKNDKNDKNNPSNGLTNEEKVEEKTTKERIDEITKEIDMTNLEEEPKQDVDEALDDLMKTKKLELGDLDL